MSVTFTWTDFWNVYETAENERKKEIEQEARKVLLTLPTTEQIKALVGCPRELLEDISQDMSPQVRRIFDVSTRS